MSGIIIYVATFFCSIYKVERIVASSNRCKGTEIIKKRTRRSFLFPIIGLTIYRASTFSTCFSSHAFCSSMVRAELSRSRASSAWRRGDTSRWESI